MAEDIPGDETRPVPPRHRDEAQGNRSQGPAEGAAEPEAPPEGERPGRDGDFDRTRRPGIVAGALRALVEELSRPRARVRRAVRRARHNVRSAPLASALGCVLLSALPFCLYATGVGLARAAPAAAAFLGAFVVLAVGGPLLLAYAWPVAGAFALSLLVWGACELEPGVTWLLVATVSAFLIVYLASAELAPLVGAGGLARLALELGRTAGIVVFVLALGVLYWAKRRVTPSILAAAWVGVAGSVAAQAGWLALRAVAPGDVPAEWMPGILPRPLGLLLWTAGAALFAASLVWRRAQTRDVTPADLE